jgi:hypothetical protein
MLILNPLEKLEKIPYEKSYQQKHDGNMHFFLFHSCLAICFAYNFFV